jgi:hypothetical protein
MTEPHEAAHEAAEQAEHHGSNKKIALLIAILALFLAFSETLGKSSQTNALSQNVEASNLWAFFQAKTIRSTLLRTATENMMVDGLRTTDPAAKAAQEKQIDSWKKTSERYDSEPSTGEGRKELADRAKHAEERRDHSLAKYHNFELASAAFQVAIVLASATIITGMLVLSYLSIALGVGGLIFMAIGLLSPHLIHALPFIGGH